MTLSKRCPNCNSTRFKKNEFSNTARCYKCGYTWKKEFKNAELSEFTKE